MCVCVCVCVWWASAFLQILRVEIHVIVLMFYARFGRGLGGLYTSSITCAHPYTWLGLEHNYEAHSSHRFFGHVRGRVPDVDLSNRDVVLPAHKDTRCRWWVLGQCVIHVAAQHTNRTGKEY